ncbi:MAG: UDP-N-acetylmuramoyl-L-alanyl-D-glutamate--2,6-diaminopimelate ligase [Gemmobacter sp.]
MTGRARTLADLGLTAAGAAASLPLAGITADSRAVAPGFLFAALAGSRDHGARHVPGALARGAAAILTDAAGAEIARAALAGHPGAALVVAEDARAALAMAAALWFGAQPRVMAAVTGTNGKTSVASFTRQIWTALGHPAINLGTTGVEGAWTAPSGMTTPDPVALHRLLSQAAQAGITHAAMEASSHGLDQRRLDGVRLAAAGFTNLTQDHLDYHGTMEAYFDAKCGLFDRLLPPEGTAVINADDPRGAVLAAALRGRGGPVIATGTAEGADLRIAGQRFDATGQDVRLIWQGRPVQVHLTLVGGFQAANVAVAAGLAIGCGAAPGDVFAALPRLATVRGRMERVAQRANGATVYVDYAHTPDAVDTALAALRPHVMGRVIAVIGAGGDRDRGKRPLMGAAAARRADHVFVTDDNPRSEDPGNIRAAVLAGCPSAEEVGDRAEAILRAAALLAPGDALLICGKGHETGQEIAGTVYPFDDAEQASLAVAALDGAIR